ncbi:16S rRNA (cytidine(1402)-2'-O)-methyltransferase [Culicoidibacter larvae]|uniref:Ribosomal RNA small subunit methyltransferase I n=1 Tax=Culicoidibacter larvae TaxID=2579976 RepID=A0A5R8QHD7_9FIRM|nr:16S rRNA (cytidine(1402)-2'-O)-methyltransferase [Culicoidibacter larvae]TLG77204.1 16S rRNA (cytidine(1402)-2'-O)-methyltransferase [Culicoidibacter larvae]
MQRQKSFATESATLYLVGTPIGNLEDITMRAVRTLKEVDWIAAEDTRVSRHLCNHYDIETPIFSMHEHNEFDRIDYVIELLSAGNSVAVISDAGLPCISDPGARLVHHVTEAGFAVVPIPGANAGLSALMASGLEALMPFVFYGFLEHKKPAKLKQLQGLQQVSETLIFYESPHRIKASLELMLEIFGDRQIVLARELTKKFEEFIRGTLSEVIKVADDLKGEMVIIVSGYVAETVDYSMISAVDHVQQLVDSGMKEKDAIKAAAKERGVAKDVVYKEWHNI